MKVITELELRDMYREAPFTRFTLPAGAGLTPAAAQFLNDRKITVSRQGKNCDAGKLPIPGQAAVPDVPEGFTREQDQGTVKREHQTHLRGSQLVTKNHPRIKLRGKLDHLQAEVLIAIIDARRAGLNPLAADLQELLDLLRLVMKAEVTETPLQDFSFSGLNHEQIRQQSHHPDRYLGTGHFMPEAGQGVIMARLNLLRTLARQVELSAVDAFCQGDKVEREDLLRVLNRTSSIIYIMMCRLLSGWYYKPGNQE